MIIMDMDLKSLAAATGMAFSDPSFPPPADVPVVEKRTTITYAQQNGCSVLTAENCRARGQILEVVTPSGLSVSVDKFQESSHSGASYSYNNAWRYSDGGYALSLAGGASASTSFKTDIEGTRLKLGQNFKVADVWNAQIRGSVGADLTQLDGRASMAANLSATLSEASLQIPPVTGRARDILPQLGINPDDIRSVSLKEPLTVSFSDSQWKEARSPNVGLTAALAGKLPLTDRFSVHAGIGGRAGADSITSRQSIGLQFDSGPRDVQYTLGATVESLRVHQDRLYDKLDQRARTYADTVNTRITDAATDAGYQGGNLPQVKHTDILKIAGLENPYLRSRERLILEGGVAWNTPTTSTRAFIRHSQPLNGSTAPSFTEVGVSHSF